MQAAPISPLSRRFLALVIDGVILAVFAAIFGHLIPIIGGLIVWFLYAPILEASPLRATIGKHLLEIQVTDLHGEQLSLRTAVIRNGLKLASTGLLFLGYLFAFFNDKKQAAHDLLAETIVTNGQSPLPFADTWWKSVKDLFQNSNVSPQPQQPSASFVAELERLQTLRDKGALTDEEFETAKRKILS